MENLLADYDSRIVDLYDGDNPDGPDHDYYRSLAVDADARRILDVGCGTGILTVTFAAPGRTVVGVDPSHAMISYARKRAGSEAVTWIEGDSSDVVDEAFDLMVMTGNVAQHIPDPAWGQTLVELRQVASAGAILAFESRNPAARAWESWAAESPMARETASGPLVEWCEADELDSERVLLSFFNRFGSDDEVVKEDLLLTFRSVEVLTDQLAAAGFRVSAVWGDWDRTPFDGSQAVMVFEARPV